MHKSVLVELPYEDMASINKLDLPYPPGVAPSDYSLFVNVDKKGKRLKGPLFSSNGELKLAISDCFVLKSERWFRNSIASLKQ